MQKMIKPAEKKTRLKHRPLAAGLHAVRSVLLVTGLLGMAGSEPVRAADSVQLNFKYTVTQGTCALSFTDVSKAPISVIDFGVVKLFRTPTSFQALAGTNSNGTGKFTPFNIELKNCVGSADSNTAPVVSMTGAHIYKNGSNATGYDGIYMFRSGGSSDGLGILIYKDATGPGSSQDMADVASGAADNRKYFVVPGNGKGSALNGNFTIPVSASVGCGSCGTTALTGDLIATVTFNFSYR